MIEPLKKYSMHKPDGVRRVGRPKLQWEDGVEQDMRILEVKNWKRVALNRDKWTKLLNPFEHTAGCETVETSMSFACNSSFLSVDGMTCLIPFES